MTAAELLRDMRAEYEARKQYRRAVDSHFRHAKAIAISDPRASIAIARGAAILRMDARAELRA